MNSRERLLATIRHEKPDHVPLYCWCFGFPAPPQLRWTREGREVPYWYTMRLEHIHTLPEQWTVEDDFERVRRWTSLGVDDVLEASPPWGMHREVCVRDWQESPTSTEQHWLLCREYQTPAGSLRHVVRRTDEKVGPGWVVQPQHVALFEDFNIPRGIRHAVVGSEDLPKLRYLRKIPSPGNWQPIASGCPRFGDSPKNTVCWFRDGARSVWTLWHGCVAWSGRCWLQ